MADPNHPEVTDLLGLLSAGDHSVEETLLPRIYLELHRLASSQLRQERRGHTLQPTALVHEAYLRIFGSGKVDWQSRGHFFRVAARTMRRILIDYARQRNAANRGSGIQPVSLTSEFLLSNDQSGLVLEVDEALGEQAAQSPRLAQIVEMQFFAGLTETEIAEALDINERTVRRDWAKAGAWLHQNSAAYESSG